MSQQSVTNRHNQDIILNLGFPAEVFREFFGKSFEVKIVSDNTIYKVEEVLSLIDELHENKEVKKQSCYSYYDNNKNIYLAERIYINRTDNYLLCLASEEFYSMKEADQNYSPGPILGPEGDMQELEEIEQIAKEEIKSIDQKKYKLSFSLFCFEENYEKSKNFLDSFLSRKKDKKKIEREINLIAKSDMGLYLEPFKTIPIKIDLESNYNEDFKEVYDVILKRLNSKNDKGLVLLSGIMGSGKSSIIRLLTQEIKHKKIIYISPDMSNSISEPDFITFLLKHSNSILLIEDAENIIKSRKSGGSQAVSNLLNLSDGLLGDALKIQIVCTFNASYEQIDEALKRPGRLIAKYEFDKLTVEKSRKLYEKLFKEDGSFISDKMTLSEIYNFKNREIIKEKQQESIGFNRNY